MAPSIGHIPDPVTKGTLVYCPSGGRILVVVRCLFAVRAGEAGPKPEKPANHDLKSAPGGPIYEGTLCYWVGDVPKPSMPTNRIDLYGLETARARHKFPNLAFLWPRAKLHTYTNIYIYTYLYIWMFLPFTGTFLSTETPPQKHRL